MRLAIISDIHSNLEALETALEIIDRRGVDRIICLGDVVGYGANPSECLTLVRKGCEVILMGNHDLAAVDVAAAEDFNTAARVAAHWTNAHLGEAEKEFLRNLPYTARLENNLFVHASPHNPESFNYILSVEDAIEAFAYFEERCCFTGHTHVPGMFSESGRAKKVTETSRYLINVGSIGQPRDGDHRLSFGFYDTESMEYENVREEYDVKRAAEKIIGAGLPPVLGERLMVGL